MKISLIEWDQKNFSKPHHVNTLRTWAKTGLIQPKPEIIGREYMCDPNAVYVPAAKDADSVVIGLFSVA